MKTIKNQKHIHNMSAHAKTQVSMFKGNRPNTEYL